MSKISTTLLVGLSAYSLLTMPTLATDRYGNNPAIIVSPDLSAPWVMQLREMPAPLKMRKVRTVSPDTVILGQPSDDVIVIGATTTRKKRTKVMIDPQFSSGIVQIEPQRTLPEPLVQQASLTVPSHITEKQSKEIDPQFLPQEVSYDGSEPAGTIVIDTGQRFLFLVEGNGQARRYGVGVGKPGFEWSGTHKITRKAEWPDWTPPQEMKIRVRAKEGRILPDHMDGGPNNPLGARAMYLGATQYRIHGTNQPWTIGHNVSSGCIRMRNEDVTDLYERVGVGTTVIVQ